MKRKPAAFFRCMMRASTLKGDSFYYAWRYLRKYHSVKGLRPYKAWI